MNISNLASVSYVSEDTSTATDTHILQYCYPMGGVEVVRF